MKIITVVIAAAITCGLAYPGWAQDHTQQDNVQADLTILSLEDAITRALEAAPSIRASEEAVRASDGSLRQAGVRPNPEISVEAANFGGSGAFDEFDHAELTLGLGQKLERGGKRSARIGLAEAERNMANASASISRNDVIYNVRRSYIETVAATAEFNNAEDRAEVARELEEAVGLRARRARASAAAEHRIAALALAAQANLDQARYALDMAKQQLSALWGEPRTDFAIDEHFFAREITIEDRAFQNSTQDALALLLAKAVEKRASAALELERSNAKQDPTVSVGVRQFQQSDDVAAIVSLSMPIALFNTNQGSIDRAAAKRRQAEWLARDVRRRFDRELATNMASLKAAHANVRAIQDQIIPKAQSALQETRSSYDRGATTYLEVLEAQRALQEFQAHEILALKRFHITQAALDRLLATNATSATDSVNRKEYVR